MAFTRVTLSSIITYLFAIQEDLENLCLENVSLAQKLDESSIVGLTTVTYSFEISLFQVEHIYSPLHISSEKVRPNQMLKYGKVVSFIDQQVHP